MKRRMNTYQALYEAINEAEEAVTHVSPSRTEEKVSEQSIKSELQNLIANEVCLSGAARALINTTSALSTFDVGMTHISQQLMKYAKTLSEVSDSNLAIIEETTANLNMIDDNAKGTSETLEDLSTDAKALADETEETLGLLKNAKELKDELVEDMKVMAKEMSELMHLVGEVNEIVDKVQAIAGQTNLLALNASIEAARAGEMGKGFAVVADEVRKLADDTNEQLVDMRQFVSQMNKATEESKSSLEKSVQSGNRMGEMIDGVAACVQANTSQLNNIVEDVHKMNASVGEIRDAIHEVNAVMDTSSDDAEQLANMTTNIHDDAEKSVDYAKQLAKIDDELSAVIEDMYRGLEQGRRAPKNEGIKVVLLKAKEAHENWLKILKQIADEGVAQPLQVNPKKCVFGHCYYAFQITNPAISQEWKRVGTLHETFHSLGKTLLSKLNQDQDSRQALYDEAVEVSKQLIGAIDKVIDKLDQMTREGRMVFEKSN